jgi:drug/metabolite transporter (DMT)-like permease
LATQAGLLTIAGVLTSLYPAVTVVMAAALLRERVRSSQGVGLALAGASVALIAAG